LKLLVDVGVSRAVELWLEQAGHDTLTVRGLDAAMKDDAILALAAAEERLLITMDKDFGELVVHSGKAHAGVLLLRLEDATSEEKVQVVQEIFREHVSLLHGNYCTYQRGRLRIRSME
jgi:predicted nuclease of predicted toxin-antitoxin system